MLATEAPASVSGGVELGPVLITSPREGRGVLRPGMKAAPSAAERSTPPLRVIRDVKESIVSVWGGEAGYVSFTIKIVPQRQHDRHKTIETLGSIPTEEASVAGMRAAATKAKATIAVATAPIETVRCPSPLNEPGVAESLAWYRRDGGVGSIPTEETSVADVRAAVTEAKAAAAAAASSVASDRFPSPLSEPGIPKRIPWYRRDGGAGSIPTEEASVAGVRVAVKEAKAAVAVAASSVGSDRFPWPLNKLGLAKNIPWYRRDGGAGLIPTEETSIAAVRIAATEAKADAAVAASSVASVRFPSPLNEPGVMNNLSWYRRDGGAGSVPTEETSAAGVRVAAIEAKTAVEVPSSSVASVRFPSLLNEPGAVKSLSLYRRDDGAGSIPTEETSVAGVPVAAIEAKTAVEVPSSSVAFVRFPSPLNEAGVTKSLPWHRRDGEAGSIPTEETSVAGVRVAATEAKAAVGVSSSSVAPERSPSPLNEP